MIEEGLPAPFEFHIDEGFKRYHLALLQYLEAQGKFGSDDEDLCTEHC